MADHVAGGKAGHTPVLEAGAGTHGFDIDHGALGGFVVEPHGQHGGGGGAVDFPARQIGRGHAGHLVAGGQVEAKGVDGAVQHIE